MYPLYDLLSGLMFSGSVNCHGLSHATSETCLAHGVQDLSLSILKHRDDLGEGGTDFRMSLSTGRQSFGITGLTPLFTPANAACTAVMFWKGSKPVMSTQSFTHPPLVYRAYAESSLYANGQVKHIRE